MMKTRLITAVALAIGSMPLHAADMMDTAPVVSATPIVDRVTEPRQECAPAQRAPQQERSVVAPIIGGVAGALLGSTVGRGNGRTAATAAGAIGGAIVGDQIGNPQSTQQPQQQCRTVETTREIVRGYTVVYRYNGRDITTTMPYDPGLRVNVAVTAVDSAGKPVAHAPTGPMMGGNVREVSAPRDHGYTQQPVYTEQRPEHRAEPRSDYTYRY